MESRKSGSSTPHDSAVPERPNLRLTWPGKPGHTDRRIGIAYRYSGQNAGRGWDEGLSARSYLQSDTYGY